MGLHRMSQDSSSSDMGQVNGNEDGRNQSGYHDGMLVVIGTQIGTP